MRVRSCFEIQKKKKTVQTSRDAQGCASTSRRRVAVVTKPFQFSRTRARLPINERTNPPARTASRGFTIIRLHGQLVTRSYLVSNRLTASRHASTDFAHSQSYTVNVDGETFASSFVSSERFRTKRSIPPVDFNAGKTTRLNRRINTPIRLCVMHVSTEKQYFLCLIDGIMYVMLENRGNGRVDSF